MRHAEPADTKGRILDVAEHLFAELGLDRVSVRDITEKAGVNLGAINYHFGSKNELIAAVFERRINPVNTLRLDALDEVERAAGTKPPKVEAVLEAFVRPTVACATVAGGGGNDFAKLFGRCLSETRPEVEALLQKQFEPLTERLIGMLAHALPKVARADIHLRMKFTFGALHHWLLTKDKWLPDGVQMEAQEAQMQKLIAFAAAGFRAR